MVIDKDSDNFFKIIDCKDEVEQLCKGSVKPKRYRRKLNYMQIDALEQIYIKNNYPNKEDFLAISNMLMIPLKNCKIWFQNRRAKDKNEMYEKANMTSPDTSSATVRKFMKSRCDENSLLDYNDKTFH